MSGDGRRSSRRAALVVGLLVALVTFAVFSRAIPAEFVLYDDDLYVTENPFVRGGPTAAGLRFALTRFHLGTWQPPVWLSFMLDVRLFGLDPRGFHLVNVVLHAANAALLFALLRTLTGALAPAALAALLFSLHPLRVESVAWVAQRKDTLSLLFALLALLAYAGYARRPGMGRYRLVTLLLLLGLAAKPTLLTLPLVMFALDFWPLGRTISRDAGPVRRGSILSLPALRPLLVEKVPWLALCGVGAVVALLAQHSGGSTPAPAAWDWPTRLAKPLWATGAYFGKTLWPANLIPFYPFQARSLLSPAVLGAGALLAALTLFAAATARRRPWLAAGFAWYLVGLAPSSGIVPFGAHDIADRFTYLPMIGPALALAAEVGAWASRSVRRSAAAVTAAGLALAALAGAAWVQIGYWHDSRTLFARMLAVSPGNEVALFGMGAAAGRDGDFAAAERYLGEAAQGRLYGYDALVALAGAHLRTGRRDEAAARFAEALALRPDDTMRRIQLGALLLELGRPAEALPHLEIVVRAEPEMAEGHNNLGVALTELGRLAEAGEEFRRALELNPGYEAARVNLEAVRAASAAPFR